MRMRTCIKRWTLEHQIQFLFPTYERGMGLVRPGDEFLSCWLLVGKARVYIIKEG